MAARQTGFFVRHTEKIVLSAAVAFSLLLVLISWSGIFGSPASTRIGNDIVSPSNLQDVVQAEADKLRQALDASEPGVPDVLIPNYSDEFAARIAAPMLPAESSRLVAVIGNGGLPRDVFVQRETNHPAYVLPTPPVVTNTTVKVDNAVLARAGDIPDPIERELVAELSRNLGLPAGSPGDFQYVSVMARFPLADWAERLEQPDPQALAQPIPRNVWRPRLMLGAVYLQRQQLDEQSGTWGEPQRVEQLASQVAYVPGDPLPELPPEVFLPEAVISDIESRQTAVTQPAFPPTRYRPWTPPGGRDRVFSPAEQQQLAELDKTIAELESQLARLLNRDNPEIEEERPNRRRPRAPRRNTGFDDTGFDDTGFDDDTGPRAGRRGGLSRGGGFDDFDDGSGGADPNDRRTQRLRDELRDAQTRLKDMFGIDAPVAGGLTFDDGGGFDDAQNFDDGQFSDDSIGGFQGDTGGFNTTGRTIGGVIDNIPEEIVVWTHDLTAEPGQTYRYKLVAAPVNPLFQYSRVAEEQRIANRDLVTLAPSAEELAAIDWSPAVTLNPKAEFFFLGGNPDQDRARVEVWKIYDGLWQTAEFEENSGNAIGGERTLTIRGRPDRVDLSTGSLLLDIDVQQDINLNPDQRLVYETPTGRIQSRTRQLDSESQRRAKLQAEAEAQRAPVATPF